jgi:hypothetical protein
MFMHYFSMKSFKEIAGEEWMEWYQLTPTQRRIEAGKLWHIYLQLGGSLFYVKPSYGVHCTDLKPHISRLP